MIAGRFHWKPPNAKIARKYGLAAFDFRTGTLALTEAGTKKRASLYLVRGADGLQVLDTQGLEIFDAALTAFRNALTRENHTLKRALTDPHLLSGIGNACSHEILHRARLSPVRTTDHLSDGEVATLFEATRATLREWTDRLRREAAAEFPEHVTAFRKGM